MRRKLRQWKRLRKLLADAAHHTRPRIETNRHIGAGRTRSRLQMRIIQCELIGLRDQAQRRSTVGRAAAEPGRDGQILFEVKRAQDEIRHTRRERACRLEHEIIGVGAGLARRCAAEGQRQCAAGRKSEPVAAIGEYDQAFELVIAVGAAAKDSQRQVHLGRCVRNERN